MNKFSSVTTFRVFTRIFLFNIGICLLNIGVSNAENLYPYITATIPVYGHVKRLIIPPNNRKILFAMVAADGQAKPSDKLGIYVFDLADAKELKQLAYLPVARPTGMDITPDGKNLLIYSFDGILKLDVYDPKTIQQRARLDRNIAFARLSNDGRNLYVRESGHVNDSAYSFDIYRISATGNFELQSNVRRPYSWAVNFFSVADGKHLFVSLMSEHIEDFVVYDVSDPAAPKEEEYRTFNSGIPRAIGKDGILYSFKSHKGMILSTSLPEIKKVGQLNGNFSEGDVLYLNEENKEMYVGTYDKSIYVIDLTVPSSPRIKAQFSTPDYIGSVTPSRSGSLIYVGLLGSIVVIDPRQAGVTSEKLINAHVEAMKQYKRKDLKLDFQRVGNAINVLEASGIQETLGKKPDGISDKALAEILNDYGFFLSKANRNKEAIDIYRRVIQLDQERSIAYLNLGDSLRAQLSAVNSSQEKEELTKEIKSVYLQFKQRSGRSTSEIDKFMSLNVIDFPKIDFCDYVASYANQGKLMEIFGSGESVVKTDGKGTMRVEINVQGTARMPSLRLIDNASNAELTDSAESALAGDTDDTRWAENIAVVPFSDGHHLLYFNDGGYLISSSPIGVAQKTSHSCSFKTHLIETLGAKTANQEICHLIQKTLRPPYIAFDESDSINDETIKAAGFYETSGKGAGHVDFDNDGADENLVFLQYASGAGRGCDYNYFDLLNKEGDGFSTSKKRALLLKLQGVGDMPHVRHPVPSCSGNTTGWFRYNGVTYFETKYPGDEPTRDGQKFHTVSFIKNGEINKVCDAEFRLQVEVQH